MAHRLPGSILRDHLRRISCALARAFKADLAGARPSNHVAVHVRDRHDCVVKCRKNMRDAGMNILAPFGLDDLRLRPGARHGAIIERRTLDREARERRRSLRHLRHDGADCERRRRRGDRCGILRDRIESVGSTGAPCRIGVVCVVDYRLRRISDVDASRHGMTN